MTTPEIPNVPTALTPEELQKVTEKALRRNKRVALIKKIGTHVAVFGGAVLLSAAVCKLTERSDEAPFDTDASDQTAE